MAVACRGALASLRRQRRDHNGPALPRDGTHARTHARTHATGARRNLWRWVEVARRWDGSQERFFDCWVQVHTAVDFLDAVVSSKRSGICLILLNYCNVGFPETS